MRLWVFSIIWANFDIFACVIYHIHRIFFLEIFELFLHIIRYVKLIYYEKAIKIWPNLPQGFEVTGSGSIYIVIVLSYPLISS